GGHGHRYGERRTGLTGRKERTPEAHDHRKENPMKKSVKYILVTAACLLLAACAVFLFLPHGGIASMAQDTDAAVTYFTRFGTTLTLEGEAEITGIEITAVKLVMTDDDAMYCLPCEYTLEGSRVSFRTSEKTDGGIQLEGLPEGKYILLLRAEGTEGTKETVRYYPLVNGSEYEGITYWSLSCPEGTRRIDFYFGESILSGRKTACLDVQKAPLPEDVYDAVLEVGHGGDDPGAIGWLDDEMYTEFGFNHPIAMEVKRLLTEKGYKVALTHEDDSDPESYGPHGRAVLCNELRSKYSLSIHCNASAWGDYRGTEIYAPGNSDYTFPCLLSEKVVACGSGEISNTDYSSESYYMAAKGVWVRLYNEDDVKETNAEAAGYGAKKPYENLTVMKTNWYYMIREVGGVSTGAYTDGRHSGWPANPYWNSNDTCEGYIIECDYVDNPVSLQRLLDHPLDYARGIAEAFCEYAEMIRNDTPGEIPDWKKGL
ncbi:MAG: N-acetylmuramoyl-L-alanine amidase, partial [Eubacteriaceae bacterium]|nr:N-acetylmuramoyl-L-alanine amidase [Eubacteriaceae bacterium]